MSTMCDLYCYLLLQCDALRACRSGLRSATKRCCCQDVKAIPDGTFSKQTGDAVGSKKEGMLLQPARHRMRDAPQTGCALRTTSIFICGANNARCVITIVVCCRSVKLCALPLGFSDCNSGSTVTWKEHRHIV